MCTGAVDVAAWSRCHAKPVESTPSLVRLHESEPGATTLPARETSTDSCGGVPAETSNRTRQDSLDSFSLTTRSAAASSAWLPVW